MRERIAQAYLFWGMEGTGRKEAALAFAKALNCLSPDGSDACGKCVSCCKIEDNVHPDIVNIKPAGAFIRIDQIKSLQKSLMFKPLEAKRRVIIIQEAGALNRESANCLLKTLEEPPEQSLIILTARDLNELLPTIVSRCQIVRFQPLPPNLIANYLATNTQGSLSPEEAGAISCLSGGSLYKAINLSDSKTLQLRTEIFGQLIHLTREHLDETLALAEFLAKRKDNLSDLLNLIKAFLRDVLIAKKELPEEFLINKDFKDYVFKCAEVWKEENVFLSWTFLSDAEEASGRNFNRQLILENAFLHLTAS